MITKTPFASSLIVGATVVCIAHAQRADERHLAERTEFAAARFYKDLRQLVRRYYPDATTHLLKNSIHFEHDTRLFIVHEATKTGVWQDPWAERGPKKDGIYCDIEYRDGKYQGAAKVPQSFDKRYFTVLLLAPYSKKLNGHLYVHLKYPNTGTLPEGFLQTITKFINDFEQYVDNESG